MTLRAENNAAEVAAALERLPALMNGGVITVSRFYAQLLLVTIQRNASHRPGPEIQGREDPTYVDSWSIEESIEFAEPTFIVFTDAPQAERLENGYFGEDARGREYSQPAFPHVRPAEDEVTPLYLAAVNATVDEVHRAAGFLTT